jgi:DNA-binding PucR family transcriptional regulator
VPVGPPWPDHSPVDFSKERIRFVANLPPSAVGDPAVPVLLFDSLGVYRMLSSVADPAGIEAFMKEQLGPLLDYDKRHHSGLLVTLAEYFDSGCSVDQAAAALSVHRSTVKYRLKRVRELLGQDLNDGPTRTNLHLATMVWLTLESLRRTGHA